MLEGSLGAVPQAGARKARDAPASLKGLEVTHTHTHTPEAEMNESLPLAGPCPKKGLEHAQEAF